jgi:seryl-tRNA synthetase
MKDIKLIRDNPDLVKKKLQNRGAKVDVDRIVNLDKEKRKLIQEIENLKAEKNKLGAKDSEKGREIKEKIKNLEPELEKIEKEFNNLMLMVPNLPLDDVWVGKDERDNKVIKKVGPSFAKASEGKKDYLEIAEKLDIIDVQRAAKVSGSRFGYLKGGAVLLEFGLIQLAFDVLIKEGFIPVVPPVMIKSEMARGMGYLEQLGKEEAYYLPQDDLYLVGTSEQSLGTMHAGEIFNEKDLPRRYVGFSTCFRREAGSYGKDTKGILRVHQFDKVEMFSFTKPEDSIKEHKLLLSLEEKLMNFLEIPYRIIQVCTGDLSVPSASTYDVEAWMPGGGEYRETHSTSNCTDFQARRLNIRYKTKDGKVNFVHTLNGTAFAIGRTLIAIIENYQQKDGSIKVPKVLQKYIKIKNIK